MKEYTIEIEDSAVRSTHDLLKSQAQGDVRAKKWAGDQVSVSGDDDEVAEMLAYLIYQKS